MGERLSLRQRFALFFAAIFVGGTAALATGLWVGYGRGGGAIDGYVIAAIIADLGLLGLVAWIAVLFDENVAKPIQGLASDLQTRAQTDLGAEIDVAPARYLGALAPAATAIHDALNEARAAQAAAIEAETARLAREKALFEALLRDLAEGVIVATPDNRIMLYNRAAQDLLGGLGLDRPVSAGLRPEPLDQAIARMEAKRARGQAAAETFLAATADGQRYVVGRVNPVLAGDERIGHVLILRDATEDLRGHGERDHLFNTLMEQVRRPASAMGAVLDVLRSDTPLEAADRARFDQALTEELGRLFTSLREMEARHGAATTRHWPMSEVATDDIFDGLKARGIADLDVEAGGLFAQCDGFAVLELLAHVLEGLAQGDRRGFRLRAEARDREVWLTLGWAGEEARDGLIQEWLGAPLSNAYGQYSGRDALAGHRTELWCTPTERGHRIVLPLAAAGAPALAPGDARPEFYDFNLPKGTGELGARPLRDLAFVVFDTETTGLNPRGGDEIVQIAGVRIVNGRVLRGEVFDTLVDPGCPIPAASTAVHGLGDADVAGAPAIREAGRAFHDFCEGAVLVAHNAPFDLAFLTLKEPAIGRVFDMPALCTVLLSAAIFEHSGDHTLDALADRLGVEIGAEHRHTALGDALATAEVFRRLIDVMTARGIETLDDAFTASARMTAIRRAQAY